MTTTPRTIVITGASSGLGAALATVAAACATETLTVPTDVTRRADHAALRDAALARFGAVDVWINNAGQGIARPVLALSDDDVDQMVAVNVKSVLYGAQAIIPHFQARAPGGQGHLINVSSFLARVPLATLRSAYAGAKTMMNALSAMLRMDLARTDPGIHISVVMPGIITTPFAQNVVGTPPPPGAFTPPAAVAPQSAELVAEAIAQLVAAPVPELYTNPAQPELVERYYHDVAAFEASLRAPR